MRTWSGRCENVEETRKFVNFFRQKNLFRTKIKNKSDGKDEKQPETEGQREGGRERERKRERMGAGRRDKMNMVLKGSNERRWGYVIFIHVLIIYMDCKYPFRNFSFKDS